MDTNHHLLSGVLALQVDLIDEQQFLEACRRWTANKELALTDVLLESGWITRTDESDIERFVERRLRKHNRDAKQAWQLPLTTRLTTTIRLTAINHSLL